MAEKEQMGIQHLEDLPSRRTLLLVLAACPAVKAQQLRGRWGATAGEHEMGGAWTAQPPAEADAAYGTWSLLDRAGRRLVSGTWSARKVKEKWEGRWQAEVEGGRKHAGSWTASGGKSGALTLMDLFRLASGQIVSGTWQSDSRLSGSWSIRADQ